MRSRASVATVAGSYLPVTYSSGLSAHSYNSFSNSG